jgi:hypothetical protein
MDPLQRLIGKKERFQDGKFDDTVNYSKASHYMYDEEPDEAAANASGLVTLSNTINTPL